MLNDNYICALDIGSSKIAGCVAEIKKGRIGNICFDSISSRGLRQGIIVDSIDLIATITSLMKRLKVISGINIKFVNTNISGKGLFAKHSNAIIPLAERGNKIITASDIKRVNEQARILVSNLEDEIIHVIPSSYTIDSKDNVINPIGLYGHALEVDLCVVCTKVSVVQGLNRAINQSGYEIKNLFFSGLATTKAVFDRKPLEGLNLFCDIGGDITELLIFRNGVLEDLEILSIGGNDLTKQIQEAIKIPFDLAEDIKKSHGLIENSEFIAEDKEILVKKEQIYEPIKLKLLTQIINSCVKSICQAIKGAVEKKVPLHEINNFIVVGRSVFLEGFIEALESNLSVPVRLGRILNSDIPLSIKENDILSCQKYLTYLTALGMICPATISSTAKRGQNFIINGINSIKEVYQEYF